MRIPFSMDNTSTFNRAKQDSSLKSIQVECLVSKSSRKTPPPSIASPRPPASSNVNIEQRPSLSILNRLSMYGSPNPLVQQNAFPISGISSPLQSSSRKLEAISSCRSIDFIQRHSKMSIMSEMSV